MNYSNNTSLNKGTCEQPEQDFHLSFGSKSANKIVQSTNLPIENISSEVIKELTLKNKLLNAQLTEYKTMVCTLERKISELTFQNRDLTSIIANQKIKIHSSQVDEGLKEISKTVPQFGKKQISHKIQEQNSCFSFQQIRQLFSECQMIKKSLYEKADLRKSLRTFTVKYQQMSALINSIWKMKKDIQAQKSQSLSDLWQWLKILGWNYYYLLREKQKNRFNPKNQSTNRKKKAK